MPRPAKIWKRGQNDCYYAKINGKQERLSPDYKEALELFHTLKKDSAKKRRKKTGAATKIATTLKQVADAFLSDSKATKEQRTFENLQQYLQSFADHVGSSRRVYDITGQEFNEWSRSKGWGSSTQAAARSAVMACFNWGVRNSLLFESPLWGQKKGHYERRERILKPAEREMIRGVIKGSVAEFIYAIEQTGARPFSEIGRLTAEMIDWDEGSALLPKHKNQKKGKRRVLYFPPPLLEKLRELAAKRPEGPLFRTQKGRPWNRQAACRAMRRIEKRTGLAGLTPYVWRHSYIVDALERGLTCETVAQLVGNSVRVILRYYNHLDQKKDHLRESARKAVGA